MLKTSVRNVVRSLAVLLLPAATAFAEDQPARSLPDTAIAAILTHGPWPGQLKPDPANNLSGNSDAVALGRLLFFDARLSPSGRAACSSCHRPEKGFADPPRRFSRGVDLTSRNTPSLLDVGLNKTFGWTGAHPTLWQQTIRPILDPREMGSSAEHVRAHISGDAALAVRFRGVAGFDAASRPADDVLVAAAKSLAAYQGTISSGPTAFDRWRDALASGDAAGALRYPAAARRGAALFVTAARCSTCHSGPAFSDSRLHRIGGRSSEDAIRTPPLRNVGHSAPYLHDGRAWTLLAAIRAHDNGQKSGGPRLNEAQAADIVSFLRTLDAP